METDTVHPNDLDNDDIVVRVPNQNPVPEDDVYPLNPLPKTYTLSTLHELEGIIFERMTDEQNENLTEDQLLGIQSDFYTGPGNLPPAWVRILMKQFANPSGKWSDFNAIWKAYYEFRRMACAGLFSLDALPPSPPNPADYPNNI